MSTTEPAPAAPRTFKVRAFVETDQIKKDLAINPTDLTNAMLEQASMRLHYGELAARASKQVDDCKMLLEITESKVDRRLRDDAAAAGEKVTEASLTKAVQVHERVIGMRKALNECRQIENLAKSAVESFKDRRDVLIQLGARDRAELEGEVRIAVREAGELGLENQKKRLLERLAAKGKEE